MLIAMRIFAKSSPHVVQFVSSSCAIRLLKLCNSSPQVVRVSSSCAPLSPQVVQFVSSSCAPSSPQVVHLSPLVVQLSPQVVHLSPLVMRLSPLVVHPETA
jgi:hypothetical protein